MRTKSPAPAPKAAPLSVGRYAILGRATSGVPNGFRARDPETNGLVAVYLFPNDAVAEGRIAERLAAACAECAANEHPNVLRVLDSGPEGNNGYLIAEWTEVTTLAKLMEGHGRLPEGNVVRFAAQIAQALDHTRSGDLALCRPEPGNVLVRADGQVKVIPFGLSDERAPPPRAASALLKPQFAATLAPDYAGVKRVPFPEAIFALGALTHEALTGVKWAPPPPPPPGKRRRPPPRLTGLTERSERAIRRATDPDPAKRPASGAEFMKVLRGRAVAAGTPKTDARVAVEADNRRGSVRYALGVGSNCTISTSVFGDAGFCDPREVWPLVVQDVSATGLGLLLARRCEPGTELAVEVASGSGQPVWNLSVRVVRVKKDNFGHWVHGCAFPVPLAARELNVLLSQLTRPDGV